jgi:drug/metabolite transporter (DMT)-like permease
MGVAVLVLLFGVMWGAMSDAIAAAMKGANPLTQAGLVIILPTILFSIIAYAIVQTEPTYQQGQQGRKRLLEQRRRRQ